MTRNLRNDPGPFFRMRGVNKIYPMGDEQLHALKDVNLDVERGEYLSVLGSSGSGKSTLMNIIGCLDVASSGRYSSTGRRSRISPRPSWPTSAVRRSASSSRTPSFCPG